MHFFYAICFVFPFILVASPLPQDPAVSATLWEEPQDRSGVNVGDGTGPDDVRYCEEYNYTLENIWDIVSWETNLTISNCRYSKICQHSKSPSRL